MMDDGRPFASYPALALCTRKRWAHAHWDDGRKTFASFVPRLSSLVFLFLHPRVLLELRRLVRFFPGELRLGPAEVAVRRGLFINGPPEVQGFHDALGRHVEVFPDDLDEFVMMD